MNQQYVGSATNPRRDASLCQPPSPLHPFSSLVPIHTPSAGEAQRKKFLAQEQNTMSMQGLKTRSVEQESRVH